MRLLWICEVVNLRRVDKVDGWVSSLASLKGQLIKGRFQLRATERRRGDVSWEGGTWYLLMQ